MKTYSNDCDGTTVVLSADDDLDQVPDSHRDIVTPAVRAAFQDPTAYFDDIIRRSELLEFTRWVKELTKSGRWALVLDEAFMMERSTVAGFRWKSETAVSALIGFRTETLPNDLPATFRHFYSLVGSVHWEPFGHAGYLNDAEHPSLSVFGMPLAGKRFSAEACHTWGCSACGDRLIYNRQGEAAFLSHETMGINELGSIANAINWVFRELTAGRTPEFDYASAIDDN